MFQKKPETRWTIILRWIVRSSHYDDVLCKLYIGYKNGQILEKFQTNIDSPNPRLREFIEFQCNSHGQIQNSTCRNICEVYFRLILLWKFIGFDFHVLDRSLGSHSFRNYNDLCSTLCNVNRNCKLQCALWLHVHRILELNYLYILECTQNLLSKLYK